MFKIDHYFQVSVEERRTWSQKIKKAFADRGVSFEVDWEVPEPSICYFNFNPDSEEVSFGCGSFWNDETNLIPVIAMAHELGHYIDLSENFDGDIWKYDEQGTNDIEVRAWLCAVDVLKELGFTRWETFFKYASDCLNSYFAAPFSFEDFFRDRGDMTFEFGLQCIEERIGLKKFEKVRHG